MIAVTSIFFWGSLVIMAFLIAMFTQNLSANQSPVTSLKGEAVPEKLKSKYCDPGKCHKCQGITDFRSAGQAGKNCQDGCTVYTTECSTTNCTYCMRNSCVVKYETPKEACKHSECGCEFIWWICYQISSCSRLSANIHDEMIALCGLNRVWKLEEYQ